MWPGPKVNKQPQARCSSWHRLLPVQATGGLFVCPALARGELRLSLSGCGSPRRGSAPGSVPPGVEVAPAELCLHLLASLTARSCGAARGALQRTFPFCRALQTSNPPRKHIESQAAAPHQEVPCSAGERASSVLVQLLPHSSFSCCKGYWRWSCSQASRWASPNVSTAAEPQPEPLPQHLPCQELGQRGDGDRQRGRGTAGHKHCIHPTGTAGLGRNPLSRGLHHRAASCSGMSPHAAVPQAAAGPTLADPAVCCSPAPTSFWWPGWVTHP